MNFAIYGAQGMALGAYESIKSIYPERIISCFIVTTRSYNASVLDGLPVVELKDFSASLSPEEKSNTEILIAVPEDKIVPIEQALDEEGLFCHVRYTAIRWGQLKSYYHVADRQFMPLAALPVGYHRAGIHVYKAMNVIDKPLTGSYTFPEWVTAIQTGASLTDKRVANFSDNIGDNISDKNRNYCELTALYWVWKNRLIQETSDDDTEYYGLAHYRRILNLTDDDILRLVDNDVDVVLPFPMPYEPNMGEHHKHTLTDREWNAVPQAIKDLHPDDYRRFETILHQKNLFNYNIILARKKVLCEYCEWLFPLLFHIEELSNPDGTKVPNRYIGYIGETLETIYFMSNKEKFNIVHTGIEFLV